MICGRRSSGLESTSFSTTDSGTEPCAITSASARDRLGSAHQLYWLRCSDERALTRCLKRNGSPGAFLISEEGFSGLKARFECPGPDESYETIET
jgi:hypothetical protein